MAMISALVPSQVNDSVIANKIGTRLLACVATIMLSTALWADEILDSKFDNAVLLYDHHVDGEINHYVYSSGTVIQCDKELYLVVPSRIVRGGFTSDTRLGVRCKDEKRVWTTLDKISDWRLGNPWLGISEQISFCVLPLRADRDTDGVLTRLMENSISMSDVSSDSPSRGDKLHVVGFPGVRQVEEQAIPRTFVLTSFLAGANEPYSNQSQERFHWIYPVTESVFVGGPVYAASGKAYPSFVGVYIGTPSSKAPDIGMVIPARAIGDVIRRAADLDK